MAYSCKRDSFTILCNPFSSSSLFNSTSLQLLNTLLESFSNLYFFFKHSCSFFLISSHSLLCIWDTKKSSNHSYSPISALTAIGPTGSPARATTVLAAAPVPVPTPAPSCYLPDKSSDLFLSFWMLLLHCVICEWLLSSLCQHFSTLSSHSITYTFL